MSVSSRKQRPNRLPAAGWSLPPGAVHAALLLAMTVAVFVVKRRWGASTLPGIGLVAGAALVVFQAALVGVFAFGGRRVPRRTVGGLAAILGSSLCALLGDLPGLAPAALALRVAFWVLVAVGVPLALAGVRQTLRGADGHD